MSITDYLQVLGLLIAIITSTMALYRTYKTTPKEIKAMDVDLSEKYQNLADRSLNKVEEYEGKLQKKEARIEELECRVGKLEKVVKILLEGVDTLINQLEEQNIPPKWSLDKAGIEISEFMSSGD